MVKKKQFNSYKYVAGGQKYLSLQTKCIKKFVNPIALITHETAAYRHQALMTHICSEKITFISESSPLDSLVFNVI